MSLMTPPRSEPAPANRTRPSPLITAPGARPSAEPCWRPRRCCHRWWARPGARSCRAPRGGEEAARQAMEAFLAEGLDGYARDRQLLREGASSRLSPYLRFGCISPRELEALASPGADAQELHRQLCWRDFYAQVLRHFPENVRHEHQRRYRGTLRFERSERAFQAWREGRTGYPIVDAAMRQLASEGWLPNRARLISACFLCKDLGIDWRCGERWFMRQLLDGDVASNNGNWQWIASVGVDPQPPAAPLQPR